MYYIYMWQDGGYVLSQIVGNAEVLKCLMADAVWLKYDMCYLAW